MFNGDTLLATVDQQTASGVATGTAKTRYVHPDHLRDFALRDVGCDRGIGAGLFNPVFNVLILFSPADAAVRRLVVNRDFPGRARSLRQRRRLCTCHFLATLVSRFACGSFEYTVMSHTPVFMHVSRTKPQ